MPETTNIWVEVMNSKRQVKENMVTLYKFTFAVCRKSDSKSKGGYQLSRNFYGVNVRKIYVHK